MRSSVDPAEEAALWRAMRDGARGGERERLVEIHLPFARMMAAKAYAKRPHSDFEFAEYMQFATVGLLECVDRYDPAHGASFRTYATHRISGAILNGLETMSERQEQAAFRKRMRAERLDSLKSGEAPDEPSMLFAHLASIAVGLALGYVLEDSGMFRAEEASGQDNSYQAVELKQLCERVRALVGNLPERERKIIRYHYFNHVPFESVAELFGLSKGRVSQLHRRAIELLRDEVKKLRRCDIAW